MLLLKKITLILSLVCILCFMQITNVSAGKFDPETTGFSKLDTIKTWLRTDILKEEKKVEVIQRIIASIVPQNQNTHGFFKQVENDKEIRYFDEIFPTIAAIELPFLQFVHDISRQKSPVTMEIAAATGFVSWKVPLAFETDGMHYANELSPVMNEEFDENIKLFTKGNGTDSKGNDLSLSIIKLPGSCFEILHRNPELKNKVDAVYVQNLEHFLNPIQHQQFINLIANLLAPGGQAFLCAPSFAFDGEDHPLYKLYQEQKKNKELYSGFAQFNVEFTTYAGTEIQSRDMGVKKIISNAMSPKDDAVMEPINLEDNPIGSWIISKKNMGLGEYEVTEYEMRRVKRYMIGDFFSPEIYRNAVALHPSLEVIDAFFIDGNGIRKKAWDKTVLYAAAIIRKKKDKENVVLECSNGDQHKEEQKINTHSVENNSFYVSIINNLQENLGNSTSNNIIQNPDIAVTSL